MKKIEFLDVIIGLFNFKEIMDENGNEYVFFERNPIKNIVNIQDKTEFEALENHIHLLKNIKKNGVDELVSLANKLGNMLFNALKYSFPNKYFYVYITIALHGSFIVRFHQKWENEIPYYNVKDFDESKEIILVFEG